MPPRMPQDARDRLGHYRRARNANTRSPWISGAPVLMLVLAACRQETLQLGDLRVTQTAVLTNNTLRVSCAQFYANGKPRSNAALDNADTGDVAMAHELITGIGAILAQVAKGATGTGMGQAVGQSSDSNLAPSAAACLGEHFKGEKADFPPPTPPPAAQAPQGDDDHPSLMPQPQTGQGGQQHPRSEPLS